MTSTRGESGTRRIILLGSTGSIGTQALEVVEHLNALADAGDEGARTRYEVVGLAAGRNADAMLAQAARFGVRELALADGDGAQAPPGATLRKGPDAAERLVREVPCDLVLGAMVGSAGLPATLAAAEAGIDVALANKETLVAAGALVTEAARRSGAALLPVDSEHSAIWQCLASAGGDAADLAPPARFGRVRRVVLTASGGALRDLPREKIYNATPEQALQHPNWAMGAKVTIDCASLTNKALEVIEAHWLYGLAGEEIGVVVHPQSIVHSFVEFVDGNVIVQMGPPDMKLPIQHALTWPRRVAGSSQRLGIEALGALHFAPPDLERFPALGLAWRVIGSGGTSGAVLNAANERAVEAFMEGAVPFGRIAELSEAALDRVGVSPIRGVSDVLEADAEARRFVETELGVAPAR